MTCTLFSSTPPKRSQDGISRESPSRLARVSSRLMFEKHRCRAFQRSPCARRLWLWAMGYRAYTRLSGACPGVHNPQKPRGILLNRLTRDCSRGTQTGVSNQLERMNKRKTACQPGPRVMAPENGGTSGVRGLRHRGGSLWAPFRRANAKQRHAIDGSLGTRRNHRARAVPHPSPSDRWPRDSPRGRKLCQSKEQAYTIERKPETGTS